MRRVDSRDEIRAELNMLAAVVKVDREHTVDQNGPNKYDGIGNYHESTS